MKSTDLKNLVAEARPVIERMLDDAELLAGFRDAATEKGIDWSQVKSLLKAQIQDERDGAEGKRVSKIIEKADHASAYADMLGLSKMNENNFSLQAEAVAVLAQSSATVAAQFRADADDPFEIPPANRRTKPKATAAA